MSDRVEVAKLPPCDIHIAYNLPAAGTRLAKYDGKTKQGPWANMCEDCFKVHGIGLGTGLGQKLVLKGGG